MFQSEGFQQFTLDTCRRVDATQITTDESNAENPAIYENIVVWTDLQALNADIYGYCLPPSISQSKEVVSETEEKLEEGKEGICLGTLFIALVLIGGLTCLKKRQL